MNPTSTRHRHPTLAADDLRSSGIRRATVGLSGGGEGVGVSYSFSLSLPHLSGVGYPLRIFCPRPLLVALYALGRSFAEPYGTPTRHPTLGTSGARTMPFAGHLPRTIR